MTTARTRVAAAPKRRAVLSVVAAIGLACATGCVAGEASGGRMTPQTTLALATDVDEVSASERERLLPLVRAHAQAASDSVEATIRRDLARGSGVPRLNLASLATNYSGDPGEMDGESPGGRITEAGGLTYLEQAPHGYDVDLGTKCRYATAEDSAFVPPHAAHPWVVDSMARILCDVAIAGLHDASGGISPDLRDRMQAIYSARRRAELAAVSGYLEGRIGYGGRISADEERAVMYLDRLAAAVIAGDGTAGDRVQAAAERAIAWRNRLVAARAVTADLREELAMRDNFAAMEAGFARNQAISDGIVAEKASRTPAQRDSARRAVCTGLGIDSASCPP